LQKTPFYDVKDTLLEYKRRPLSPSKKGPFSTPYPPSLFVKIFLYYLNTELELLSYPYAYRNPRGKQAQNDDIYSIIHTKIEKKK